MVKDTRVERNRGFIRILAVCSYMQQCRTSVRSCDILESINRMTMYDWCARTIYRDLIMLSKSGVLTYFLKKSGRKKFYVFTWNGLENLDCAGFISNLLDDKNCD